jgi:hypothetical protein
MALPTLDATFASSADLPRRQMLAKWLVEELGETQAPSNILVSGLTVANANGLYVQNGQENGKNVYFLNGTNFGNSQSSIYWNGTHWYIEELENGPLFESDQDVAYPWLVTTWTPLDGFGTLVIAESPAPSPISNYYDLPERYLWAKIAVAAGAPRGEADYISLPKNYAWSDIYNAVSGDIANSTVVVSGLSDSQYNGLYVYDGLVFGRPSYRFGTFFTSWNGSSWTFGNGVSNASSDLDVAYPWLATGWYDEGIDPTGIILTPQTPNHTDWSENVALGHIAAAYRGDTGNPANLATYIDWPWRYKVASIIVSL